MVAPIPMNSHPIGLSGRRVTISAPMIGSAMKTTANAVVESRDPKLTGTGVERVSSSNTMPVMEQAVHNAAAVHANARVRDDVRHPAVPTVHSLADPLALLAARRLRSGGTAPRAPPGCRRPPVDPRDRYRLATGSTSVVELVVGPGRIVVEQHDRPDVRRPGRGSPRSPPGSGRSGREPGTPRGCAGRRAAGRRPRRPGPAPPGAARPTRPDPGRERSGRGRACR